MGRTAERAGGGADRYELYELCVQDAAGMAAFLAAVHGGRPRVMREDFCGGGAVCRAWVGGGGGRSGGAGKAGAGRRAIAVDLDPRALERLSGVRGLRAVAADVMDCDLNADIISATNFPIGYWHTRRELMAYLKKSRARLNRGGVFVCDTYGGPTAMRPGRTKRSVPAGGGRRVDYTWEQRSADPLTGLVVDVLHFQVFRGGKLEAEVPEAFTYSWRLWSIAELREAIAEAGFRASEVYTSLADAVDGEGNVHVRPVREPEDVGAGGRRDYVAYIAARA